MEVRFPYDFHKSTNYKAPGGLGGLKLDEIEAANPFLTLPTAKNGLRRPVISQNLPQENHRKTQKNTETPV